METKICKKCGSENYVEMKFCSECGNPFTEEESFVFCSECGTKNNADEKFCSECGTKLGEDNAEPIKAKKEIKEKKDSPKEISSKEEEFIFCPNCGAKNLASTKYCEECGTNIKASIEDDILKKVHKEEAIITPIEEDKEDKEEYIFCPNCGAKNTTDTKFCSECGSSFDEAEKGALSEDAHSEEEVEETTNEEVDTVIVEEDNNVDANIEDEDYVFCPNCGAKNTSDTKFCSECGSSFDEDEKDVLNEDTQSEEKVEKTTNEEVDTVIAEDDNGLSSNGKLDAEESLEETIIEKSFLTDIDENIVEENANNFSEHDNANLHNDTEEQENTSLEDVRTENDTITDGENNENFIFCSNCGAKNTSDTKFCKECGSKLTDEEPSLVSSKETIQEEEKNKDESISTTKKVTVKKMKPKKSLKALIILLVLVLVETGCFFAYKNGLFNKLLNKNTEEKENNKNDNKDNNDKDTTPKDSWSSWVEKLPENITEDNYTIEEKVQYSVSKKEEKTSSESNLKGWTLDEEKNASNELVKEVEKNSEIKKFESLKNIKIISKEVIEEQYVGILCGYYTAPDGQNRFYLPNSKKTYCNKDNSYTLTDKDTILSAGSYKVGDDLSDKSYTNTDGTKINYKVVEVLPYKVKYTYIDTDKQNTYHYYRWTSYRKYSDEKVEESETVKVKERKVYRYKAK